MGNLHIELCDFKLAKFACENFHYSKTIPLDALYRFSVYEYGNFIGVVLYGLGVSRFIGRPFGLPNQCVLELQRVALNSHTTPTSSIVARCTRKLKQISPHIDLLVSFADTSQGHVGTIYQAMNWYYLGSTTRKSHMYLLGDIRHKRSVYSTYGTQSIKWVKEHIDPNAYLLPNITKHKYVLPLKRKHRKLLEAMQKPYPKLMSISDE